MQWHPFAEKFPLLDGDEREALKESIKKTKGIKDAPIFFRVVDGKVQGLDGRNRFVLCKELRIKPAMKKVRVPDDEVVNFILRQNVHRRHMTKELRQMIVAELRAEGESTREIATTLNVSPQTVLNDLKAPGVQNLTPDKIVGKDGKQYDAKAPKLIAELKNLIDQSALSPKLQPDLEELSKPQQLVVFEHVRAGVNPRQAIKEATKPAREPGVEGPGKRRPGSGNGRLAFDWEALDKHLGPVMRAPDQIARAYPDEKKEWEYGEVGKLLDKLAELFKEWRSRLAKVKS